MIHRTFASPSSDLVSLSTASTSSKQSSIAASTTAMQVTVSSGVTSVAKTSELSSPSSLLVSGRHSSTDSSSPISSSLAPSILSRIPSSGSEYFSQYSGCADQTTTETIRVFTPTILTTLGSTVTVSAPTNLTVSGMPPSCTSESTSRSVSESVPGPAVHNYTIPSYATNPSFTTVHYTVTDTIPCSTPTDVKLGSTTVHVSEPTSIVHTYIATSTVPCSGSDTATDVTSTSIENSVTPTTSVQAVSASSDLQNDTSQSTAPGLASSSTVTTPELANRASKLSMGFIVPVLLMFL